MGRYKNNTLRGAYFLRPRHDLTWDDVLNQFNAEKKNNKMLK